MGYSINSQQVRRPSWLQSKLTSPCIQPAMLISPMLLQNDRSLLERHGDPPHNAAYSARGISLFLVVMLRFGRKEPTVP